MVPPFLMKGRPRAMAKCCILVALAFSSSCTSSTATRFFGVGGWVWGHAQTIHFGWVYLRHSLRSTRSRKHLQNTQGLSRSSTQITSGLEVQGLARLLAMLQLLDGQQGPARMGLKLRCSVWGGSHEEHRHKGDAPPPPDTHLPISSGGDHSSSSHMIILCDVVGGRWEPEDPPIVRFLMHPWVRAVKQENRG